MEYTKGKWTTRESVSGLWHVEADDGGELICTCKPNSKANAKLIAAAPELYEACKGVIARRMECHKTEAAYIPSEIEAVYKALAKAEGK